MKSDGSYIVWLVLSMTILNILMLIISSEYPGRYLINEDVIYWQICITSLEHRKIFRSFSKRQDEWLPLEEECEKNQDDK